MAQPDSICVKIDYETGAGGLSLPRCLYHPNLMAFTQVSKQHRKTALEAFFTVNVLVLGFETGGNPSSNYPNMETALTYQAQSFKRWLEAVDRESYKKVRTFTCDTREFWMKGARADDELMPMSNGSGVTKDPLAIALEELGFPRKRCFTIR